MVAAIIGAILFQTVSDDPRSTMLARRRQGMNCALETIERVRFAFHHNLKSLVVVIAAGFACRHFFLLHAARRLRVRTALGQTGAFNCRRRDFLLQFLFDTSLFENGGVHQLFLCEGYVCISRKRP